MALQTDAFEIDMERAGIPGTSLEVSRVALGTWAIGGWMWGGTNERESVATIRAAVEHGINLIDTAPVYGFGRSEEIVGKALAESGLRSRVLIATKTGLGWEGGRVFRDASRARILREVEDSLRRLRTDCIDIYQALARPTGDDRRNRGGHARPARSRKDSRHRRQQFLRQSNGAFSPRCAGACASASL
jgi:aryl-alcohol dehydrogenase-like predicted oxidoreductase